MAGFMGNERRTVLNALLYKVRDWPRYYVLAYSSCKAICALPQHCHSRENNMSLPAYVRNSWLMHRHGAGMTVHTAEHWPHAELTYLQVACVRASRPTCMDKECTHSCLSTRVLSLVPANIS